ncbi:hypothetical protein D3C81_2295410 [compost metagenome]
MNLLRRSPLMVDSVRQIHVQPEPPSSAVALIFRKGAIHPRVALLQEALVGIFGGGA